MIVHSIFSSTKRFRESLLGTVVSNVLQIVLSRLLTIFKHHCIDREDCCLECYIFEELKLKKITEMKSHLSSEYNVERVLYYNVLLYIYKERYLYSGKSFCCRKYLY